MKKPSRLTIALSLGLAFFLPHRIAGATQLGVTQIVCDGAFCGGSGGSGNTPFLYKVKPNGNSITSVDIGVDDSDINHYTNLVKPTNWTAAIVTVSRSHRPCPTPHGGDTGQSGSCTHVLRFSKSTGATQTSNFNVGFTYTEVSHYHDVTWKTSGNWQADWGWPLGTGNGPVHSPVTHDDGCFEEPFAHDIEADWVSGQTNWDGESQTATRKFLAGHMALIPVGDHRGQVLAWNWMRVPSQPNGPLGLQHWSIIDVSGTPSFFNEDLEIPTEDGDLFCSGHAWTRDGHLLVAGGDRYYWDDVEEIWKLGANTLVYRFDPTETTGNDMWVRELDELHTPRWYPTVTTLSTDAGDSDILLVLGGLGGANNYEAFDPSAAPGSGTWQEDPGGSSGDYLFPGPTFTCNYDRLDIYPRSFLLSTGEVFFAGIGGTGRRLNHTARMDLTPEAPIWTVQSTVNLTSRDEHSAYLAPNVGGSSSAMLDVVVRLGGELRTYNGSCVQQTNGETDSTESCDGAGNDPGWTWSAGPTMVHPRLFPNAVLLPDASALVVSADKPSGLGTPTYQAEVLEDGSSSWRALSSAQVRRGYHSAAVLLPDARVLVGGGENREADYEIFLPHYLTNGAERPQLVNPPATLDMEYGLEYELDFEEPSDGVDVERVVLMAPASVTHHSDMHQRYVELDVSGSTSTSITFDAPPSSAHAPRGYYMLFLVTNAQSGSSRAPSEAVWVHLE